jgi:hypothetical protein
MWCLLQVLQVRRYFLAVGPAIKDPGFLNAWLSYLIACGGSPAQARPALRRSPLTVISSRGGRYRYIQLLARRQRRHLHLPGLDGDGVQNPRLHNGRFADGGPGDLPRLTEQREPGTCKANTRFVCLTAVARCLGEQRE